MGRCKTFLLEASNGGSRGTFDRLGACRCTKLLFEGQHCGKTRAAVSSCHNGGMGWCKTPGPLVQLQAAGLALPKGAWAVLFST